MNKRDIEVNNFLQNSHSYKSLFYRYVNEVHTTCFNSQKHCISPTPIFFCEKVHKKGKESNLLLFRVRSPIGLTSSFNLQFPSFTTFAINTKTLFARSFNIFAKKIFAADVKHEFLHYLTKQQKIQE